MQKSFDVQLQAIRENVLRYYDLCLVIRNAKDEMRLLDDQFDDLSTEAQQTNPLEWLLSCHDRPFCREWEEAHPEWQTMSKGIRKRKTTP